MSHLQIGPIEVFMGEKQSRTPYSTSILIKGKEADALIDCGAGRTVFDHLKKEHRIHDIYMTHYHLDHIWGLYLFPEAKGWINHYDILKFSDLDEIARANGYYAIFGEQQARQMMREERMPRAGETREGHEKISWASILAGDKSVYPYDQPFELAGVNVIMLHAPGHCAGFCCPYFPEYGVLHVGDFDLTSFGPWYNNADSDIDAMIASAQMTLRVDADTFVTSHQKGVVERSDYRRLLETYMAIIDKREEKVLQAVRKGVSFEQLIHQEVFYLQKNVRETPRLLTFETMGVVKHLKRLLKYGEPIQDYYQGFLSAHGMHGEYVDYGLQPPPCENKNHTREGVK
ncbi:MBL fold metallo-hydrolase [Brevibacillus choshinensis]|uniref:MBL fold metallo-hydrolase n=1 Tax=Brevibacillus choshinensis TaxID=54911 RepID=UPI002E1C89B5|nr:MBL fold metallo-hydrolase [Brevibacillus choshinensis]